MILFMGVSLIICAIALSSATAIAVLSRSHNYPDHFAYYDYQSYENTNISYVVCAKDNPTTTKQCTVVLENNSFDEKTQPQSCNITIEPEKNDYKIDRLIRVVPFGKKKSIVIWWEIPSSVNVSQDASNEILIGIATVHFTSCKLIEEKLPASRVKYELMPFMTALIKYEEYFEVVYPNDELCKDKYCKVTSDEEGNIVSDAVHMFNRSNVSVPFVVPVDSADPALGCLVVEQGIHAKNVSVALFKDGVLTTLKTYPHSGLTAAGYTSTAHNTLGFCSIGPNKTVNCAQFDTNGNLKLEASLTYDYQTFLISMLNLENGGFLLLIGEKLEPECQDIDCFGKLHDYHVTKYDETGERVGSMKLKGLHCEYRYPYAKIFEKREKEYCVAFTCFNSYDTGVEEEAGFVDLAAKCFFEKKLI